MAFTVKDIITDAYDRTGIFPNSTDELPGEYAALGLKLLKAIISQYNIKNYLIFNQNKITIDVSTYGEKLEDGSIGILLKNDILQDSKIASISNIMVRRGTNTKSVLCEHVPYQLFDNFNDGQYIYTYKQFSDTDWVIYLKNFLYGRQITVVYNEQLECNMNTEYYAPEEYKELFILALSSKLLTSYPRTSDKMKESIDIELTGMLNTIEAKQYNNKLLMYNNNNSANTGTYGQFITGAWL